MGFLQDIDNLRQQADGAIAPPPDLGMVRPGRLGTATIDAVREIALPDGAGTTMEFDLTVSVDGSGPYPVRHRQAVARTLAPSLQAGATIPVRVDPVDRLLLTIG
jgi:hypothetical protein